jgi:hypothetical protein
LNASYRPCGTLSARELAARLGLHRSGHEWRSSQPAAGTQAFDPRAIECRGASGMTTPTVVRLALLKGDYDPILLRGKNPGWRKSRSAAPAPSKQQTELHDFPNGRKRPDRAFRGKPRRRVE